jgi:hypothetical protein
VLTVAAATDSLNTTITATLVSTSVALLAGVVEVTVGTMVSAFWAGAGVSMTALPQPARRVRTAAVLTME